MSKKIQVAFYKGTNGSILNKTIKILPNSKQTHVELVVGNYWYGSVTKFGGQGISKIRNPEIDSKDWEFKDIDVSDELFDKISRTASILVGYGSAYIRNLTQQLAKEDIRVTNDLLSAQYITYVLKKYGLLTAELDMIDTLESKTNYIDKGNPMDIFMELEVIDFSITEVYFIW